ncbi:RNA-binding protein squid-like isoform X2 [Paramacrobiotus metropolitanus]|nr:RNA-binding protein squid-like isoform X2 [Paramacrobiotus metropolitanus]
MFVGGLSLDTDEEDMKSYFQQYGTVVHAVVKRDPNSGRSRCFGFVTFANSASLRKVGETKEHILKGRRIDPKTAEPRTGDEGILKIFVGGIDPNMSDEDFRAYFEKFGMIKNIEWPRDRMKNQKKNFAFVEFDEERVVNEIVRNAKQEIGGKMCDVRKAIPPAQKAMQNQQHGNMGNMGMGRGGDMGWGDFSGGGGYGGGGGGGYGGYDAYAAAYGLTPEQYAAYMGQFDPSFYDPSMMAAYYGSYGFDASGSSAFDYAAAAAGYGSSGGFGGGGGSGGFGDGFKNMGGMRGGNMRSGGGGGTSPRGGGFNKPGGGMNGSGGSRGGRGSTFHPYRR